MGRDSPDRVHMGQDRDYWWTPENTVMNFVSKKGQGISCLSGQLSPSKGLCSMDCLSHNIYTHIYEYSLRYDNFNTL